MVPLNGSSHLKYLLLGGAGLFGILVLLGYPAQSAVFLAIALACPLMMMFTMGGGHGSTHSEDAGEGTDLTSPPTSAHRPH
jgi:hypothetical protein